MGNSTKQMKSKDISLWEKLSAKKFVKPCENLKSECFWVPVVGGRRESYNAMSEEERKK